MSDNSYMFVDEEKEDISKAGGVEPKGKYLDEAVTGKIEEESTINLVADEDVAGNLPLQGQEEEIPSNSHLPEQGEFSNAPSSSVALNTDKVVTKGKGLGIASLVFGVISLSLFCSIINLFASILSIVLGVAQLRRGEGKGFAIAGILCSVASVVLLIICMNLIMSNDAFVNMIINNMNNLGIYNMI